MAVARREKPSVCFPQKHRRDETEQCTGRVAAAGIAEKYLSLTHNTTITAFVSSVGPIHLPLSKTPDSPDYHAFLASLTREKVDSFLPVRCPDAESNDQMADLIASYRDKKDSIGGTVTCVIRNVPIGLGEPCFDKLEAKLAHAMLSIPATKGFEIGSGFDGTEIPGSVHNDMFVPHPSNPGALATSTNYSGGIQGGISNGQDIYFRVAFKSPATIGVAQQTTKYSGEQGTLEAKGRHDPCVVPRAVPIVEAMAALVIMDALCVQQSREACRSALPPLKQPAGLKTKEVQDGSERIPEIEGKGQGEVFGDE